MKRIVKVTKEKNSNYYNIIFHDDNGKDYPAYLSEENYKIQLQLEKIEAMIEASGTDEVMKEVEEYGQLNFEKGIGHAVEEAGLKVGKKLKQLIIN